MSDSVAISPDLPELRLICQLAGIKPSSLAAALNNSENFSAHLSADELSRYLAAVTRLYSFTTRIQAILEAEVTRKLNAKGRRR